MSGRLACRLARYPVGSVILVALVTCRSSPLDPTAELTASASSANFVYHWSPGDVEPDSAYQERHLDWLVSRLGIAPSEPLEYFKYRDTRQLAELTGHTQGTGFAEDGNYRFHTIWPKDNHEYVHALIIAQVGTAPGLFNEGVAVAHHGASISGPLDGDPLWNGSPVREQVRLLRDAGSIPQLDALIENDSFQQLNPGLSYPVAGSFVRYLIDVHGSAPLIGLIARCPRNAQASRVRAVFLEEFGEELDTLWSRWLAWL